MSTALLAFQPSVHDERLERSLWYMGGLMTIHADSVDTAGAFAMAEIHGLPGMEPPLHVHHNEDELFYVMEGLILVTRGDDQFVLSPGDSGFLPRLIPHTFKILSKQASFLVYVTPGGFENYFREVGRSAEAMTMDPTPPPVDLHKIRSTAAKYRITFLG